MNIEIKLQHRWIASVRKLSPHVVILSQPYLSKTAHVEPLITLVQHLLKHHGELGTITKLKSYRTYIQQYVLKQDVTPLPYRKVDKEGFPRILHPWKALCNGDLESTRSVISLWRLIETFRCKISENTLSITEASSAKNSTLDEIIDWIPDWSGINKLPKALLPSSLLLSNKAGPNGPATASAFHDLRALENAPVLYNAVNQKLGISNLRLRLSDYTGTQSEGAKPRHSKLVFLSDKCCKTRIIAIGDWWSNIALSDIHNSYMYGLRRLKQDCTYSQDQIPKLIQGLGTCLYSSDMTAFTDRFPVKLEEALVKHAFGTTVGILWKQILCDREFELPKNSANKTSVTYGSGNPMGLLSSWPVSTYAHHLVKQWCAHKVLGKYKNYRYLILGDDCIDSNHEVYTKYLETIQDLGISISLSKCTQSQQGNAEFAKRLFTPSGEVTGIPVDLLEGISKKPEQFIELVRILRNRGYSDGFISPRVADLIAKMPRKVRQTITFALSASEEYLGMPPLVFTREGDALVDPPEFGGYPKLSMNDHIAQARKEVFWEEVDKIAPSSVDTQDAATQRKLGRVHIPENHPALIRLSEQLMSYISSENEYQIYEDWMSGTNYELVNIPSIELYRYRNRAHKATRSRYEILRRAKAFAEGSREYRTILPEKISNWELFQKGFPD